MVARLYNYFERTAIEKRDADIILRLKNFLNGEKTVLDVGCGSGRLSKKMQSQLGVKIRGIDVFCPEKKFIPVDVFDGRSFPFPDNSFDSVFLIDVLHHTKNSFQIFSESVRVAKNSVVIKDHYYGNVFEKQLLKVADFVGNYRDKVPTPFYFKSKKAWEELLKEYLFVSEDWHSEHFPGVRIPQIMFYIQKEK
jgi:ubiquinone/menaquinone biosynthesis C-methylase UbiE